MSNQVAIQEIKTQINTIKEQIQLLASKIDNFELDPEDFADQYDDMLDDVNGEFMGFDASQILKEMDPTAYRCGLLDYIDGLDQDEEKMKDYDYAEWTEEKENLELELEELEDQLWDLEMEDEEEGKE